MTDKPEATKVESTAHYHATKLDVLAAAEYANQLARRTCTSSRSLVETLADCYEHTERLLAELDRLQSEKEKPS